jgi:hypothetical protein
MLLQNDDIYLQVHMTFDPQDQHRHYIIVRSSKFMSATYSTATSWSERAMNQLLQLFSYLRDCINLYTDKSHSVLNPQTETDFIQG